MWNLSNVLSLSRAGFAFAFFQESAAVRITAIILAMLTDFFDGFFARKRGTVTQLGAILDPIMDKFFVFIASGVLYLEGSLQLWQLFTLLSRDLSLCLFGLYLSVNKAWKNYEFKAIWWGKITTTAQFFILLALTSHFILPSYIYVLFVIMGIFAFVELLTGFRRINPPSPLPIKPEENN